MKRSNLSVSAIALTSLGLLFASACSTDDETSESTGGTVGTSGGNTYMQGGNTNRGGASPGAGGAVATGGRAANGGAATGGAAAGGAAAGGKAAAGGAAVAGGAGKGGVAGAAASGGASTAGNAGKAGAAGSVASGGASTAGNAGKAGAAGSSGTGGSNAGNGGAAGSPGIAGANAAGTAGMGTAGSGPACTTAAAAPAKGFCTPPTSLALPVQSGTIGNYAFASSGTAVRIYNTDATTPQDGNFFTGSPYTDQTCGGAGVNAAGKTGMTVTVTNNLATAVDVLLYVTDQVGSAPPYTLITLSATRTLAANATNVVLQVPFVGASSDFVATCSYSSALALNLATIREVGIGFNSSDNRVDVALISLSFY